MTTHAACLTPPGAAAIAVLAVRGPQAWDIVSALFQPFNSPQARSASEGGVGPSLALRACDAGSMRLGRFGTDAADDIVLSVKQVEPEPWLELHCHGGVEVVRLCLETLRQRGVEVCSWQELEQCTTANRLRAAALAALTEARTVRTAAILLDQVHGALANALTAILTSLDRGDITDAAERLSDLMRYAALGQHLTKPWRVVIAGAPNVGKSSLVNALAGYQRSIVAPTPGTTRDVVSAEIAADGWPVELIDTAGLRSEVDVLEEQGIQRARDAVQSADLCLWIVDGSAHPVWPESAAPSPRLVINKADLPPAWDWGEAAEALLVSAQTGAGVEALVRMLARWLVPESPPAGAAVPFTPDLEVRLTAARTYLEKGEGEHACQVLSEF